MRGRTVILTIHQPRSEIWSLFDRVILLAQGSAVYSGPASDCMPYFTDLGHALPPFCNPAEFLIDLIAVDSRSPEAEAQSLEQVNALKEAWRSETASQAPTKTDAVIAAAQIQPVTAAHVSIRRQIQVLTKRTFVVTLRDPLGLFGIYFQSISMAFVAGWIFFQMDGTLPGIRSRLSAFYITAGLQGYLMLMYETYRMTKDVQIFDRERSEGVVSITAFLLSRRLAKLIEDILVCACVFNCNTILTS
jgi:hypothetical protein